MSDTARELSDLKREIVEARNQAIKTDNQVKNLTLDIKGFEKRFDGLDGRVRLNSFGVNLMIALVIALAAYVVSSVRIKSYEAELSAVQAAAKGQGAEAARKLDEAHKKLLEVERKRGRYEQASDVAVHVLNLLDTNQDTQAGELLDKLNMEELSPLERRLAEKRFSDLRHREADAAYRTGRQAALGYRPETAVPPLQRCLALEPESRNAPTARYLLATSLYSIKRFGEAEPLLRALLKSDDKSAAEEASYLLAASLARLSRREEAKTLFKRLASADGRFANAAKSYLVALDNGYDLPTDLPGGRVRLSKAASQQAKADSATGPQNPAIPGNAAEPRPSTPSAPAGSAPAANNVPPGEAKAPK